MSYGEARSYEYILFLHTHMIKRTKLIHHEIKKIGPPKITYLKILVVFKSLFSPALSLSKSKSKSKSFPVAIEVEAFSSSTGFWYFVLIIRSNTADSFYFFLSIDFFYSSLNIRFKTALYSYPFFFFCHFLFGNRDKGIPKLNWNFIENNFVFSN